MTPAKLRAAADVVLNPPDPACATCGHKWSVHNYRHMFKGARPTPLEVKDLARAALALAELMPHLEAFADEWAKPNAHAVTLHAPGFSVAVVDLLVALGKAKESLQ